MSEFTVCYADNGYCLALDDKRIAGDKPVAMEGNVVASWVTKEKYVKERTCHMAKHEVDVSAWNAGLAEDDPEWLVSAWCWECSECREMLEESWHYCPNCGARIEQWQGRLDI